MKGRGGADDVAMMAGMRALRLRCCEPRWCHRVPIGCSDGVILNMVVMARMGSITAEGDDLIFLSHLERLESPDQGSIGSGPYLPFLQSLPLSSSFTPLCLTILQTILRAHRDSLPSFIQVTHTQRVSWANPPGDGLSMTLFPSFILVHKMVQKIPKELFGQPNTF